MDYITTKEAAAILNVTVRRVQAMIRKKVLPATKLGRDYVILREDAEWLKGQARKPGWVKERLPPSKR